MRMSLEEAIRHAPTDIADLRQEWGADSVERAITHHQKRQLRCNTADGTTSDRDGQRSRYLDWCERDEKRYEASKAMVFCTFFRGDIGNSCSRMARGLAP